MSAAPVATKPTGIDQMQELHARLGVLLADPQPGHFTWLSAYSQTLIRMAGYAGRGDVGAKLEAFDALLAAAKRFSQVAVWDEDTDRAEFDAASAQMEAAIAQAEGRA